MQKELWITVILPVTIRMVDMIVNALGGIEVELNRYLGLLDDGLVALGVWKMEVVEVWLKDWPHMTSPQGVKACGTVDMGVEVQFPGARDDRRNMLGEGRGHRLALLLQAHVTLALIFLRLQLKN